ncbi:DNA-binding transcriptional LysR family regulator [Labrenzia sp. EL_13]|nr:DNA-binding transcriptional LysR family regulator [Labrenzia sp. EL_13]
MRVFLAVMREGSTLAASRHLGLNQTTVARRIDVLEHTLDVTLFDRTTRGAEPTECAAALLPYAESLEQAALAFETQAQKGRESPPIRITAFEDETFGNIGAVVAGFVEENPGISFEFVFSERHLDMMKGEADVALRMAPAISDDRLVARKVGQTQWTYYASSTYAAKHVLPTEYCDDMEDHTVHLLNHVKSKRRNLVRCATSNDVMMALQTGQGIGPLPVTVGDTNRNLVRCFDPPDHANLPIWLITSPTALKRPDVRRFTTFAGPRLVRNLKNSNRVSDQ